MTDKLVTLASYSDPIKAQLASQRLEAAGIPTYLNGDTASTTLAGINSGIASVKLDVAESDVERAEELLAAPVPSDTGIQEQPDELDPPEDLNSSESLADRAWRAAVIGIITLPILVHLYSLWLAFKVASRDEDLSESGTRKLWAALAIDGVALLGMAFIVRAMSG